MEIVVWEKKYEEQKAFTTQTRKEREQVLKVEAASQSENEQIRKRLEALVKQRISLQAALKKWKADYERLSSRYAAFRKEQAKDEADLKAGLAKLNWENRALKEKYETLMKKQERFIAENKLFMTELSLFRRMMKKIKAILKKQGLVDILAEVAKMEADKKKEEDRIRAGEEMIYSDFKLWVEYYPDGEMLNVELWEGMQKTQIYDVLWEADLMDMAMDMNEEYKIISSNYTDIEKEQHRPRIMLRVHPDTSYGDLETFLMRIRKGTLVTVAPWEK